MDPAAKKRIRKTKDVNVHDRLRLVSNVQDSMSIIAAVEKLGMSHLVDSKWYSDAQK